jgi:hypothetical protein
VTALVRDDDEAEAALVLGAREAATSARAFDEKKGSYDVVLNCASARLDFAKVCDYYIVLMCPHAHACVLLVAQAVPSAEALGGSLVLWVVFMRRECVGH